MIVRGDKNEYFAAFPKNVFRCALFARLAEFRHRGCDGNTEKLLSFDPKPIQFQIVRFVLGNPVDCFVIPIVRLFLVVELPMRHGEEDQITAIASVVE